MKQAVESNTFRGRVGIIGVRSGLGGHEPGACGAVDQLQAAGLAAHLRAGGLDARWRAVLDPVGTEDRCLMEVTAELAARVGRAVCETAAEGSTPLVIGGDHSCAVGTWSGVHAAVRARGALGLLWFDAHLDSHTPATSHSGLLHGMPLAALLGHGDAALTECVLRGTKLSPGHVCVFGARSYEPEERELLDRIGVRVIGMREIERRGLEDCLDEALAVVRRAAGGYGVTVDLDALDPRDAPGVGTPVPGGLRAVALAAALAPVGADEGLRALEIAEYNPVRDRRGVTARHALALASSVLGARAALPRAVAVRVA